jgi:thymidylate synthase (FAD)
MKLLKQSVVMESMTPEPLELIMTMGKKCWQSEPKRSPDSFARMLIKRGHESVLEHASMSVSIITDRGITHEIVRHRIGCSYSQESTRYVKYGDIEVIDQNIEEEVFAETVAVIESAYADLLDSDHKAQIARSVLPNCLKADIGMTANFRAWRHFLKLRLSPHAHPMIREVSRLVYKMLPTVITSDICFGCGMTTGTVPTMHRSLTLTVSASGN